MNAFLIPATTFLLCLFSISTKASGFDLKYFPIDSTTIFKYKLEYGWKPNGPHDEVIEKITKMKLMDSSRISLNIEIDSSGKKTNSIDTCSIDSLIISCGEEPFHYTGYGANDAETKILKIEFNSEIYLTYSRSTYFLGAGGVARKEWYKENLGVIKSLKSHNAGVAESYFIKTLININGAPINTDSLISALEKNGVVGLAKSNPKKITYKPFFNRTGLILRNSIVSILGKIIYTR